MKKNYFLITELHPYKLIVDKSKQEVVNLCGVSELQHDISETTE